MYCEHCGKEVPGDAEFCDVCGKKIQSAVPVKRKKSAWWKWTLGIFVGLVILVAVAPDPEPEDEKPTERPTTAEQRAEAEAEKRLRAAMRQAERHYEQPGVDREDLELIESKGIKKESLTEVVGRIRNNTKRTYSYVQVTFRLYDSQGDQVGSAMANVNGLEPGGTWKFKAVCFCRGERFRLNEITGF